MVIQHNLTAMNSNRQLGITTGLQAKSSEKLSSGYKINRAADDAAGLA
ncbi:MAG: flagellin, partial [Butyrivibrio sp.]|nr:flagellin [Butyrivibrio sp.]MBP3824282.1 flagellin [Butyrivibrio sp.]